MERKGSITRKIVGRSWILAIATTVVLATGGLATPAAAADLDKAAILAAWTQPTAASYQAWDAARQDPMAWLRYQFDWSTDLCSGSPDAPLGFDFRMPCWRHDFGYRNYKAVGDFPANKARIDQAFYRDLTAVCDRHQGPDRATCLRLAKTYFTAVDRFGTAPDPVPPTATATATAGTGGPGE